MSRVESARTPVTAIVAMRAPAASGRSQTAILVPSVAQAIAASLSVKTRMAPTSFVIKTVRVKPTALLAVARRSRPEATLATAAPANSVPPNQTRRHSLPLIWMPRAVMLRACGVDHRSWRSLVTVHAMFGAMDMVDFVRLTFPPNSTTSDHGSAHAVGLASRSTPMVLAAGYPASNHAVADERRRLAGRVSFGAGLPSWAAREAHVAIPDWLRPTLEPR